MDETCIKKKSGWGFLFPRIIHIHCDLNHCDLKQQALKVFLISQTRPAFSFRVTDIDLIPDHLPDSHVTAGWQPLPVFAVECMLFPHKLGAVHTGF